MKSGAVIKGDLVVDASGRRSKMPAWLEAAGYRAPDQEDIDPKVGYSVRMYEMPEEARHRRAVFVLCCSCAFSVDTYGVRCGRLHAYNKGVCMRSGG